MVDWRGWIICNSLVNCDNGDVFQELLTDSESESDYDSESESQEKCLEWFQREFIWCSIRQVSPNGNYVLVYGCCWGTPYMLELYDISNLPNSIYTKSD